jgi:hypothetical protein
MATYSTDGGVRFAPNIRASAGTFSAPKRRAFFDYGDYIRAAFQSRPFYPLARQLHQHRPSPYGIMHQLDLLTTKVVIP